MAQAKYHRAEADRFEKLATSFREAEAALRSANGQYLANRPKNGKKRIILRNAISEMPTEFVLSDLKALALSKGLKLHVFRRLFREERDQGNVVEKVKAVGRRAGTYQKIERAASP
ncbi:MAG: hypothetical protein ABSB74_00815 [Tepidisphaeraceae bacterium]|jgi:hypothetical protein